jgi:hypothetical protein
MHWSAMDAERDRAEQVDLTGLPRELPPPADLEDRTVTSLRQHQLLDRRSPRRTIALRIAAGLVLFAGGLMLGRATAAGERPVADRREPQYILLLHGGPTGLSPDEETRVAREYGQWAVTLRAEGRFVTGERLGDAAAAVPPLERPPADLRGYFLISAASLDDAVAVAERSPHARRGGQVIVRPIDPT